MEILEFADLSERLQFKIMDLTDIYETIPNELWLNFVQSLNHTNQEFIEENKINQNSVLMIQLDAFKQAVYTFRKLDERIILRAFAVETLSGNFELFSSSKRTVWLTQGFMKNINLNYFIKQLQAS